MLQTIPLEGKFYFCKITCIKKNRIFLNNKRSTDYKENNLSKSNFFPVFSLWRNKNPLKFYIFSGASLFGPPDVQLLCTKFRHFLHEIPCEAGNKWVDVYYVRSISIDKILAVVDGFHVPANDVCHEFRGSFQLIRNIGRDCFGKIFHFIATVKPNERRLKSDSLDRWAQQIMKSH